MRDMRSQRGVETVRIQPREGARKTRDERERPVWLLAPPAPPPRSVPRSGRGQLEPIADNHAGGHIARESRQDQCCDPGY